MYVREAMTTELKICRPYSSLDDVARLMWDGNCGAVPVVNDDNKPVGIITDRDVAICAMLNHKPLWEIEAQTVIQGQTLVCCNEQESMESCLRQMEQNEVRRILITDQSGSLVGILSMGDAVAFTKDNDPSTGKRNEKLDVENVLGMLKKVTPSPEDSKQSSTQQSSSSSMRNEQRSGSQPPPSAMRNEQRSEPQPGRGR